MKKRSVTGDRGKARGVNYERSSQQRLSHKYGDVYVVDSKGVHLGDRIESLDEWTTHGDENADKLDVLFTSLLLSRMDARLHNIRKALSNTCEWLFEHSQFKEWLSAQSIHKHNGFLWIKGKPGCGKSTLMKTALEKMRDYALQQREDLTVLHYFFNARATTSQEKSTLGLYRLLTHQLLTKLPQLKLLFAAKFAYKQPGDSDDAWTKEELQDFLCDVVMSAEPLAIYVFIDALDEGEQEDEVRQMVNFLVDLSERALRPGSACSLRVCLSSRHYPHINIKKGLSLVVEEQPEHGHDINKYILQELNGSEGEDRDELVADIHRKSASIFLWVKLAVEMLNKIDDQGGSLGDMKARLDTLPGDLNRLFEEILAKSTRDPETSVVLLQWVLFAQRALEPQELYLATEYSRSPANPCWNPSQQIGVPSVNRLSRYILDGSRGLVELTTTQPRTVQFIHETVREFLVSENGLSSLQPMFSASLKGLSHETLKIGCARYISEKQILPDLKQYITKAHHSGHSHSSLKDRLRDEMPFIDYAANFVFYHAEQAQKHAVSQEVFLREQIDDDGKWIAKERLWWNLVQQSETTKYLLNETLLYFASEQNLLSLLSVLLRIYCTLP